jgi:thiol-disulfide isomerase/thioredoxin
MRKAENMKIRHSVIYLSAFRIPHTALICLLMLNTLFGFCCVSIDTSQAETTVTVQPIGEAALDELINNKNDTLIVSFIAAWCGPCIDELPALNNLYRKYKDQGLNVVGISIDLEGAVAVQPIVNKLKIEFPVYWFGDKAIQKFNLTAIPLLLVIKRGKIVERLPGRRSDKFLDAKVQEILP